MGNSKRTLSIGDICIGGDNPIAIQSMCNTKTEDIKATVNQILALEKAGCEIIRVAVPSIEAARAIKEIKKQIHIPLVADIHFDHKLALISMENGVDKVRINPGNIGDISKTKEVVNLAKQRNIPIRVGVNSGSLKKELLLKYGGVTAEGLFESALWEVSQIEDMGYEDICVSIKASNVLMCKKAYSLFKEKRDYSLHLGVTEAGTVLSGSVKSAVGLTMMLTEGLGDTIRVSLTGDPVKEVFVAKQILTSLGLREYMTEFISCPTCGRTEIDLIPLAMEVEEYAYSLNKPIKIAVMGCVVNGPGEAKEADIGIAGGRECGIIFKKGEILKKVPEEELFNALKEEIDKL